jgi:hypothetical protein
MKNKMLHQLETNLNELVRYPNDEIWEYLVTFLPLRMRAEAACENVKRAIEMALAGYEINYGEESDNFLSLYRRVIPDMQQVKLPGVYLVNVDKWEPAYYEVKRDHWDLVREWEVDDANYKLFRFDEYQRGNDKYISRYTRHFLLVS